MFADVVYCEEKGQFFHCLWYTTFDTFTRTMKPSRNRFTFHLGGTKGRRHRQRTIRRNAGKQTSAPIPFFWQMVTDVKIFHWQTKQFGAHKATDDLFASLLGHVDKWVEVWMGERGPSAERDLFASLRARRCTSFPTTACTPTAMQQRVRGWIAELQQMHEPMISSALLNVRDDMLVDLNQVLYLLRLQG